VVYPHTRAVARSLTVPHEGSGVSVARHAFGAALTSTGVPEGVRQDAMLVISELVSNAVKHGAPMSDGQIRVSWTIDEDCLRIEVTDGGAATRPNPAVATVFALGGRGLDIVRMISLQWGVTQDGESVTVWADLSRHDAPILGPRADVAGH
jgi:serine/threonine-protein kinase RsbW